MAASVAFCSHYGFELPQPGNFCQSCGQPIAAPASGPVSDKASAPAHSLIDREWQRFRGLPGWLQGASWIVAGFIALSVIGAIGSTSSSGGFKTPAGYTAGTQGDVAKSYLFSGSDQSYNALQFSNVWCLERRSRLGTMHVTST